MVSLGQKLKMPKACQKPFYKKIRAVLRKKPLQKTPNIWKMRPFWKSTILQRLLLSAKAKAFAKWSVWVKNQKLEKHAKNHSTRTLELFCGKNRSKKPQIFNKWNHFQNRPSSRGYSLCKMVSLGQKLKMPQRCEKRFYKNNTVVVLWKKPLQKTPNIRQMRPFWKSAILQRL